MKSKVLNRSGGFDELLANHKAEKEAAASKLANSNHEDSNSSSILERRLKLSSSITNNSNIGTLNASPARVVGQIQVMQAVNVKPQPKEVYCEDTLHYTTGKEESYETIIFEIFLFVMSSLLHRPF